MNTETAERGIEWAGQARHRGSLDLASIPDVTQVGIRDDDVADIVDRTRQEIRILAPGLAAAEADLSLFFALRLQGVAAQFVLAKELCPAGDEPGIMTWVEAGNRVVSTGLDVHAGWEPMGRLGADEDMLRPVLVTAADTFPGDHS